jgi:hypothetical protein
MPSRREASPSATVAASAISFARWSAIAARSASFASASRSVAIARASSASAICSIDGSGVAVAAIVASSSSAWVEATAAASTDRLCRSFAACASTRRRCSSPGDAFGGLELRAEAVHLELRETVLLRHHRDRSRVRAGYDVGGLTTELLDARASLGGALLALLRLRALRIERGDLRLRAIERCGRVGDGRSVLDPRDALGVGTRAIGVLARLLRGEVLPGARVIGLLSEPIEHFEPMARAVEVLDEVRDPVEERRAIDRDRQRGEDLPAALLRRREEQIDGIDRGAAEELVEERLRLAGLEALLVRDRDGVALRGDDAANGDVVEVDDDLRLVLADADRGRVDALRGETGLDGAEDRRLSGRVSAGDDNALRRDLRLERLDAAEVGDLELGDSDVLHDLSIASSSASSPDVSTASSSQPARFARLACTTSTVARTKKSCRSSTRSTLRSTRSRTAAFVSASAHFSSARSSAPVARTRRVASSHPCSFSTIFAAASFLSVTAVITRPPQCATRRRRGSGPR